VKNKNRKPNRKKTKEKKKKPTKNLPKAVNYKHKKLNGNTQQKPTLAICLPRKIVVSFGTLMFRPAAKVAICR
jgi:hypothetical protein